MLRYPRPRPTHTVILATAVDVTQACPSRISPTRTGGLVTAGGGQRMITASDTTGRTAPSTADHVGISQDVSQAVERLRLGRHAVLLQITTLRPGQRPVEHLNVPDAGWGGCTADARPSPRRPSHRGRARQRANLRSAIPGATILRRGTGGVNGGFGVRSRPTDSARWAQFVPLRKYVQFGFGRRHGANFDQKAPAARRSPPSPGRWQPRTGAQLLLTRCSGHMRTWSAPPSTYRSVRQAPQRSPTGRHGTRPLRREPRRGCKSTAPSPRSPAAKPALGR